MVRGLAVAVTALALSAGCVRYGGPGTPRATATPCPGVVLTLDPVRGDVNETFLRAVLTIDGKQVHKKTVDFRLPVAKDDTFWGLGTGWTDKTGAAYYDLGALVLADEARAKAVSRAGGIEVEYGDRLGDGACYTRATAEFAPSVRTVTRPQSGVATKQQLVARLQEVEAALGRAGGLFVARRADGSSACRLLHALADDAATHPEWLSGEADSAVENLRDAATSCSASMPQLAGLQVGSVLLRITDRK